MSMAVTVDAAAYWGGQRISVFPNLASALQVIAYEWRQALGGFALPSASGPDAVPPPNPLASAEHVAGMLAHWETALVEIGFLDPASPKKLMPRLQQLFNRAQLTEEEIHILRGIAKQMRALSSGRG